MNKNKVNLGNLATIKTGKLDANASIDNGEFPFFTCSQQPLRIDNYSFDGNYVLVAGNGDLNVKHYIGKFNAYQRTYAIKADQDKLFPRYLYYFLSKYVEVLRNLSIGGVIKYIKLGNLTDAKIPLPPLAEQKKIAAILDMADLLCQKDAQLIDTYNALSQSLFLDMFGDPVTNPMGWSNCHFGECLNNIIGGKSVSGDERPIRNGEKAVLKISAVTSGYFNCFEYKVVNEESIPNEQVHPCKGDLLFSRANTRDLVGATCIVDENYSYLFLPDKLWRLDLMPERASAQYIKFLLTHEGFRNNLKKVATGTSGSMLNISKAKLSALKLPLPPITLQNQFAERIQAIEAQKRQAQASLQKSEKLFNSLLQRAFKGELTA